MCVVDNQNLLEKYADWESAYLSTAIRELSNHTIDVKTVSLSLEPVSTIGGFTTLPDYDLATMPEDFLAFIIIGGNSWKDENAKKVLPLIKNVVNENKVVGGICAASEFLGANGFLNNIKHTSNGIESIKSWKKPNILNDANYINQEAVRDRKFITANGTGSLEFARSIDRA